MLKYLYIYFSLLAVHPGVLYSQVAPAHIVIVVLENKSFSQVAGHPLLPYITSLLQDPKTAVFSQSHGLTHPSQPNYLQLFSGSDHAVYNNNLPPGLPFSTPNLGASLLKKGFGFAGYSEDLPYAGYTGEYAGAYARKHSPWVNWQGNGINGIPDTQNKPFTDFPSNFSTLPTVSFIIPNQDNDMHNGTLDTAFIRCDAWLQNNLNNYIQWCKSNNSVFMLTFDEDDGLQNNRILTFITGEHIIGGVYNQALNHYNVLRTIEELYKLPYAGISADSTAIQYIWNTVAVCKGAGTTLKSKLTGAAYQWQVNTGNGFIDISNSSNYSGANTSELQLSNVPSSWYGYEYRCTVNGSYSNPQKIKITAYWTGALSTAWENPLNWSCGSLPDENTDVIIHTNQSVILNSAVSVRSFTISAGANFTQNSNQQLLITHY